MEFRSVAKEVAEASKRTCKTSNPSGSERRYKGADREGGLILLKVVARNGLA